MVRDRLAHFYPGYRLDDVVQTFEVLDIERRDDIDARFADCLDIFISLRSSRSRRVCVRDLVDERDLGTAPNDRLSVHLFDVNATVLKLSAGNDLEIRYLRFSFGPAMAFHKS